ncbi:transcription factor bHLH115-like isoform X2 [Silene latifolia]|uniref:transcription factor bHLH115-like isoform X2 n=1 Tax=Silene latifolia TaxID=37657 RepID=UPI003D76BEA1
MEFVDPNHNIGSFDDNFIDGYFDGSFTNHVTTSPNFSLVHSSSVAFDFYQAGTIQQEQESQKEFSKQSASVDFDFSQAVSIQQGQGHGHESQKELSKQSYSIEIDFSQMGSTEIDFSRVGSADDGLELENQHLNKRGRTDPSSKPKSKACRERERREKLNESFASLSAVLEPGRAVKSDKLVILNDAIRVVNQLRTKTDEYKDENKKLQEEIESLKAEKNELREEKLKLKEEKVKMEQEFMKLAMGGAPPPPPPYTEAYHGGANKMGLYPNYGMYPPMWHYLPHSVRDTTRDHVLRPPAA